MTGTAASGAFGAGLDHHVDAGVLDPNGCECVGRMTSIAVVVTGDVPGILPHGLHTVVTTEAGPTHLQVIHADNRQEVVLGMAGLAIVLSQDVRDRAGS